MIDIAELSLELIPALEKKLGDYRTEERKASQALRSAVRRGDKEQSHVLLERLLALKELTQQAKKVVGVAGQEATTPTYVVGSMFLNDCYHELVKDENERMHYVTGIQIGRLQVMDRIVRFDLDEASPVSAHGDLASSHDALMQMDTFAHRLLGLFHKHPGRGIRATASSDTDLETQDKLERGRYKAIGAIFTADGHIRFFSSEMKFQIVTYGEGVERLEEKVFRLTKIS